MLQDHEILIISETSNFINETSLLHKREITFITMFNSTVCYTPLGNVLSHIET